MISNNIREDDVLFNSPGFEDIQTLQVALPRGKTTSMDDPGPGNEIIRSFITAG